MKVSGEAVGIVQRVKEFFRAIYILIALFFATLFTNNPEEGMKKVSGFSRSGGGKPPGYKSIPKGTLTYRKGG
jgi:hypothetical protein